MQHLITSITILCSVSAVAQIPTLSSGLFRNATDESGIELRVKPNGLFSGLYSASAFTIRWPSSTNLRIDSITQPNISKASHLISTQGNLTSDAHYYYQKFAGFGMNTLASEGATWERDSEYVVLNLHISGEPRVGYFELINDWWTMEQNSDNYQELNGEDRTGTLYNPVIFLNVDLAGFTATSVDNRHALVEWNSMGEFDLSHFDVLRSTNLEDWALVQTIPASGYSFIENGYGTMDINIHPDDKSAVTIFYMLRAVDLAGNVTEYGPQEVTFTRDPLWMPYNVYPNPATDFVTIEAPAEWGALTYSVSTDISQRVVTGDLPKGGGPIGLTGLPASALIIHVFDEAGHPVMSKPIMKTLSN